MHRFTPKWDGEVLIPDAATKKEIIKGLQWLIELMEENEDYPAFGPGEPGEQIDTLMEKDGGEIHIEVTVSTELEEE